MRNCTVTRPVASRATGVLGQVRRCNRRTFASRLVIAGVDPGNGSSTYAKVAELADAPDLGSGGATRGGSSPPFRTKHWTSEGAEVLSLDVLLVQSSVSRIKCNIEFEYVNSRLAQKPPLPVLCIRVNQSSDFRLRNLALRGYPPNLELRCRR